jgi:hypothetical protein
MSHAGCTTLTKAALSAIPIHVTIAVAVSPTINKLIDKLRRAFIWTGTDTAFGG